MKPRSHPLPVLGNPPQMAVSPAVPEPAYGKAFWRSIEENLGAESVEAALSREFPPGAAEPPKGFERREFLSLVGASMALAGLQACTQPPGEKILPYTHRPHLLTPGSPLHFATADSVGGYANGLLVTSWEGRPTKIEGNPDHPWGQGATGVFEQASLWSLYDPTRARLVKERGAGRAYRQFVRAMEARATELKKTGGKKLRFLLEPSASPLIGSLRARLSQAFPQAKLYSYAPLSDDNSRLGVEMALGKRLEPRYRLDKARVILSLDSDFLQPTPQQLKYAADFASQRAPAPGGEMNRLYVAESTLSITGTMADNRLRLKPSEVQGFAMAVLMQLPGFERLQPAVNSMVLPVQQTKWAAAIAKDLVENAGRALVVVGPSQPPLVHALACVMNDALRAPGATLSYHEPLLHDNLLGTRALETLTTEMERGEVDTLVITAHNPAYASSAELNFKLALKKVPHVVYRGVHEDETAALSHWFIPAAHFLESWGDARAADGTVSLVQPLIAPLFAGRTEADVLASFLGEGEKGTYALLKDFWQKQSAADFGKGWETWLGKGLAPSTARAVETLSPAVDKVLSAATSSPIPERGGIEVHFTTDSKVFDGRFARNAWLQELPDPITKITWDNAALISPATAKKLHLESGDQVSLELSGKRLEAAVWILPGQVDDCITLPMGYGQKPPDGSNKKIGFDAYALLPKTGALFAPGLKIAKMGKKHLFATTQGHWSMQATPSSAPRPLALEATLEEHRKNPERSIAKQRGKLPTLQEPVKYDGYQWAMSVDLSRCTGCSACVVACQAENNIPVVGKEQVLKGREMQWLRLDRYFQGELENPTAITQPVACVHCEAAPCEYVCPVNATVHSDEGLNEMVYNRCVGTRYCSNNCPYKVRRFNYLHYTAEIGQVEAMRQNPDVTVRDRGVMEKCTYCVQRIERVRIEARVAGRPIKDGEIKTACQQACPTQAITFGSLHDSSSAVSKLHKDERRYDLLHELNTRPRTGYLVRLKNPNPELA
jgi:molybdopterin-containing oxidoreductase family iron-sulfur binding subunit